MDERAGFTRLGERFGLHGRVALVIGGTRGIGGAITEAFADAGAHVAVVGRSADSLARTVDRLTAYGVRAHGIRADVSSRSDRERIVPEVTATFGKLDILVNNAAAKQRRSPLLERTTDVLEGLLETNVRAYFELSLAAAHVMKTAGYGRIINVSSVTGIRARRGAAEYGITKAAEIMMTKSFAIELAEYGITVNALVPILTRTDSSVSAPLYEREADLVLNMQAIKRVATPDDIVGAALLLASNAGTFITGASLIIDGGALA